MKVKTVPVLGSELQAGDVIAAHGYLWRIKTTAYEARNDRYYVTADCANEEDRKPLGGYANNMELALRADLLWYKVVDETL